MNKLFYKILGVSSVLLASCATEQVGPDLKGVTDNFNKNVDLKVYQAATEIEDIDFSISDPVHFQTNDFGEEVTWDLSIKGMQSGAEKKISKTSSKIDLSNSSWLYGRSSNNNYFLEGEKVSVALKFIGLDSVYTIDSINYQTDFFWNGARVNGVKHITIDPFNTNVPNALSGLLAQSPDQLDSDVNLGVSDITSIEGGFSLSLKGNDLNSNGWLGSKNHDRLLELYSRAQISSLPIDSGVEPDELFFNFYAYGDPNFPNSSIQIKVYEMEDTAFKSREDIRNYAYGPAENTFSSTQQATSDGWIYDVNVNWKGWELVSIPYAAFKPASDPLKGGGGDRKKESWRITGIALSILSFPTAGQSVNTYVDYLTVTQYGRPQDKK